MTPPPAAAGLPPVLIVADHLGYDAGVVHGVTMYFLSVMPVLKRTGLRFTLCFMRRPHPAAEVLERAGIAPVFLSAARLNPLVALRIVRMVREQRIAVIHAAGLKGSLVAKLVGRLTGVRVIVHLHDLFGPRGVLRLLHRSLARPDDLGICVAAAARRAAIDAYGLDPARVRVVHNGIDLARFSGVAPGARARLRSELGVVEDAPVIGMIGRFYPVKGHRALIRAMARVARARSDALLVLVGDGPLRVDCERLVAQLGLAPQVRFLGQRNDVPELLAAMDLVAMPSELEGLPLTAIEALAAGRPVVGFDVGGMREVITDGVDGRVVPAGDEPALADALLGLIGDAAQLQACSTAALANSRRFAVELHVQRLLDCYREVLT